MTTDNTPDAIRAALWAARHGWHVLPLRVDEKRPLWSSWEERATTDPEVIRSWPRRTTGYGIACGPSGLVVVDCDAPKPDTPPPPVDDLRDGLDALAWLAEEHDAMIEWSTYQVTTGRGGAHLYYAAPEGVTLRNTAYDQDRDPSSYLGWCIDTRAVGGYVIGPGSVVGGRRYSTLHTARPAMLPAWILRLLLDLGKEAASQAGGFVLPSTPPAVSGSSGVVGPQWVEAAVRGEVGKLRGMTGQGGRNHALNAAAFTLGRLVGGGLLDRHAAAEELLNATAGWWGVGKPPFTRAEAEKTIVSGLTAGERSPRVPAPREERRRAA